MKKQTFFFLATFCLLVTNISANVPQWAHEAGVANWISGIDKTTQERTFVEDVYARHPYVALLPGLEATSMSSSADGSELLIQDLRGNSCYGQPDQLQVCGEGDTLSLLLFTKSVEPLEDIRLEFSFDDGIEYGGFASISSATSTTSTLTEISTVNPESPSFLVSEVSETDGGVVLELGIRAECGVDFSVVNPGISILVSYTAGEEACTATLNLENFGGDNVLAAMVDFAGNANQINLGSNNTTPCQTINITQTVPGAQATGYFLTVSEYGFPEGIMIAELRRGGMVIPPTEYTIDPSTGLLNYTVNGPTADGLLANGENEQVQVCYTYDDCFTDTNFTPLFTVEDA
ncbi:MAG: hypothetical protein AAF597_11595, partial [Bacteroidota bacterium]